MQGQINTKLGNISIDADVIAVYAGSVALGCTGIVGMASLDMRDGLMKLLKKENITRGIEVEIEDNDLSGISRDCSLRSKHPGGIRESDGFCQISGRRVYWHEDQKD